jgi:hypothetical protein
VIRQSAAAQSRAARTGLALSSAAARRISLSSAGLQ